MNASKHFKALVIEDNRIDACVLESMLTEFGCSVDTCDDTDFLEKLQNAYDIIFVDINMPTIDGLSIANMIRRSSLQIKDVPIIVVSTLDYNKEQINACLGKELDGYIEKPVHRELLANILNRL